MIAALLAGAIALTPPAMPQEPDGPCIATPHGVVCTNEGFVAIMQTCAAAAKAAADAQARPVDAARGLQAFLYGTIGGALLVTGVTDTLPAGYTAVRWSVNVAGTVSLLTGLWLALVPPEPQR